MIGRFVDDNSGNERVGLIRTELQQAMERNVGVFRTREGLEQAAKRCRRSSRSASSMCASTTRARCSTPS